MGKLRRLKSDEKIDTFEDMKRVLKENDNVFFKFYYSGCRPCKIYDNMLENYNTGSEMDVMICPINVHEATKLVEMFGVTSVPYTLILNKDGSFKDDLLGLKTEESFNTFLMKNFSSNK